MVATGTPVFSAMTEKVSPEAIVYVPAAVVAVPVLLVVAVVAGVVALAVWPWVEVAARVDVPERG